jgi:hypothetical protein
VTDNPYDPAAAVPPPPAGASTPPPAYGQPPPAQAGSPPAPYGHGGVGRIRSTGVSILLFIITFGIYGWFWYYGAHEEMKKHKGDGLGGPIALILAIFVSFVMPFLTSDEVGKLYERRGQPKPVSALTGLWILLPLIGGFVWFIKTNGALNDYWRSLGATG